MASMDAHTSFGAGKPFVPPVDAGLYHPESERDACGVGFIAHQRGEASRAIVTDALKMLEVSTATASAPCETK